jgi:Domain of unknown function (DUF6265)
MTNDVARGVVIRTVLWMVMAATTASAAAPVADVKDLSFLAGRWTGLVEGFQADEMWSPAANGSLMGVYREMKDGKTTFFEFLTIEQEESGPVLRLRHFKPGMKSLDSDASVFTLTTFTPGKALFEGGSTKVPVRMTFAQKGPDKLEILLERKRESGEWSHELFAYTRQPL